MSERIRAEALATNIAKLAVDSMTPREEKSCGGGFVRRAFVAVFLLAGSALSLTGRQLPDSPAPSAAQTVAPLSAPSPSRAYDARLQNQDATQAPSAVSASQPNQVNPPNPGQTFPPGYKLTIEEAESIGLRNNPQITIGRLQALQAHQYVREVRSALLPTVNLNATAVEAEPGGRLTAGYLTNGRIYPRVAGGVAVSQLITDFGRTTNLVASSQYQAKEADENAVATKQDIMLAVDQSFYNCLETQALMQVAEETVKARQLFEDQIQELTNAKLKSEVDLAFAKVDLARAQLLLLDAQDNYQASLSTLSAILGFPDRQDFAPQEPSVPVTPPAQTADPLIQQALDLRPEVRSLRNAVSAAQKYARSEHDLWWPTVNGLGVVGGAPVRDSYVTSWYGAAGVNMSIPVFNGFLFNARIKSADLATQAQQKRLQDLQNNLARDVRNSWLQTQDAYKRLSVTEQLRQQAQLALELAQARYKLGLASIVEFTQAEMQKTDADIQDTDAHYRYIVSQIMLAYQMGLTR